MERSRLHVERARRRTAKEVYKGAENNRQRLYLVFVILYKRGGCAEWYCIYLLVRVQPLLLLSNSF